MNARSSTSLRSVPRPSSARKSSAVTSYTSTRARATALTTAGFPVTWETSPVNSPGRWTVTVRGVSPERSTISTSPDLTTKKPMRVSPTSKSVCPLSYVRHRATRATAAICSSVSLGNAIG